MKVFLSLLLVMVLAFIVDRAAPLWIDGEVGDAVRLRIALSVGTMLIAAWLAGLLFDRFHLPKVSAYLLLGIAVGPYALDLVSKAQLPHLQFANDLAVSLIALTAGGEIRMDWLWGRLRRLLAMIGIDVAIIMTIGIAVVFFGRPLIPFLADETPRRAFLAALLVATVMIANSPTVVIAMISDYRAAGPLSQMTLAFTICKDLVLIVLFATVTTLTKAALDPDTQVSANFLIAVAAQLFGSIGLGALLGVIMAWYVHSVRAHLVFFTLGACFLFAVVGEQHFAVMGQDVHLEPLLIALSAGMLMENLWPKQTEPIFKTIKSMSLPVYCLFFAIAGAKMDINAFLQLWPIVLALVAVRGAAVWGGVNLGAYLTGLREPWAKHLWLGMIPQAGVTLVLITLIGKAFDDQSWGPAISSMLIGMLVIHELIGPFGFRYALFKNDEAGKADKDDKQGH